MWRQQWQHCQQRDDGEAACLHGRQASEKQSDEQQAAEAAPAKGEGQLYFRLRVSQSESHGAGQHAACERQSQQATLEVASEHDHDPAAEQAADQSNRQSGSG